MANKWTELGDVWSGRDLAEGERVTVNVFDKATQTVLEQTTFVCKAGRLGQYVWVMDLCEQVNAKLKLIRAGVQVGDKLEIQNSGYLNKFWSITDRDVQVITTTARASNWTTAKRVNIDLTEDVKVGSTLQLKVHNSKGQLLETVSFKSRPGRSTLGLCAKDFATEINKTSLYVRAGHSSEHLIEPEWHEAANWIWIPFNADFTVTWSIDSTGAWTELGEVWSGRALAEDERVTVSVFDKATQAVLEQTTFVPKAGRLDQYTWVMDLCEQINAQLKLIRAQDADNGEWLIRNSGYLNKYWGITDRDVQVITTTARDNNWPSEKRVNLDIGEDIVVGATLHLKVQDSKGKLLETVSFKVAHGRSTPGLCGQDFAKQINNTSLYVRAGAKAGREPSAKALANWIWIPFNAGFTVNWSIDLSSLKELDDVWSGRDLAEGERVTVNVFDKATQTVLEQTTFMPKAGRLDQYIWVMDLCEQVNSQLELIRAGVKVGGKLEIQNSGYLNKFWGITDRDVQVITTTARASNWTTAKRVNIDLTEDVKVGSTLQLKVHNSKGQLLETVSFKSRPGRSTLGLCAKDFATEINKTSLYVRAGHSSEHLIEPEWHEAANWIWIPFNADFTVTWSIDSTGAWTELGEVWSGRALAEDERVTVSVFDKATQAVLEQTTFVPKAGRLDQYTWVMDLCEQINAQLKLIRAQDADNGEWLIRNSGYLNKYWGITDRDVQVITTTARDNNWPSEKRVNLDIGEDIVVGATLHLKVQDSKGKLLETVSFKVAHGRSTPGLCGQDFAKQINNTSLYVRAGAKAGREPSAKALANWIWIPFNAGFTVNWSIDLSSLKERGEVWSGRDLAEGEQVTVNVFDQTTQTVLEQLTFVPKAGRLDQYTWVMDLCEQVNAQLTLVRAGVKVGSKLEIQATGYRNKFWSITDRDVQVITTAARINNWPADNGLNIDLAEEVVAGATLHLKVQNAKGAVLETVSFNVAPGRGTPGLCGQDFANRINSMSHYVRAGVRNGSHIQPSAKPLANWIWSPFNADFTVSWSIDLSSLKALDEVWSGRDLNEGERVTINVFDRATQTVLEQITFVPQAGRLDQYTWVMDLCEQVNAQLKLIRAGIKAGSKLEIKNSGHLNKFWSITDADVQVITTTARANNWTTDKRVNIDLTEKVMLGATLQLKVHNAKGVLLETVSFKPTEGRNTPGFCGKDFALEINKTSLYVRAGHNNGHEIKAYAEHLANWIWIPFNADFTVSWSIDLSSVKALDEVWSGRDLVAGERITVNVFERSSGTVLEAFTFVPKEGRLDQYTWVMDLCEQVNAKLELVRAGVKVGNGLEIWASGYRNKFWSITDRDVQVITTTARTNNWPVAKRVNLDLAEDIVAGATLHLKVHDAKGLLLETVSFKVAQGRNAAGPCGQDFASEINRKSHFVRAGVKSGSNIQPSALAQANGIWIPFNADFTVGWSVDLSAFRLLDEVWSGRDLAEGEQVTVNVFDQATQTVLEQTTFVPKAGRLDQYTWVMDLCEQVNAQLTLVRAGVRVDSRLEIQATGYRNKFWSITDRNVQVITTVARINNWPVEKRVNLDLNREVMAGSTLHLKVYNAKGTLLESLHLSVAEGRTSPGACGQDFATHINRTSHFVRAGVRQGSTIQPSAKALDNWIWIPFNADFRVSWSIDVTDVTDHEYGWSIDLASTWTELGDVLTGRDLTEGERVTVNVFDKATDTVLEQTTFVPTAGHLSQYVWVAGLCRHVNDNLKLIRAGTHDAAGNWDIMLGDRMNKYWTWSLSEIEVVTTVAHVDNWNNVYRSKIDITQMVSKDDVLRVEVRNKFYRLIETIIFTPNALQTDPGECGHDFAAHINNTSQFLRAGVQSPDNPSLIQPDRTPGSNSIWLPANANYSVSWTSDKVKEACKISADRDAQEGERITFFAFDNSANLLLDHIVLTARASANTLAKDKWPDALARLINASSVHAWATATAISQKYASLRLFTTALHLDNWIEDSKITATQVLTAADRIVVKVATLTGSNFCEALTFTPDPARLAAAQWAKDLATYINDNSLYLKAGVKDTTKKTIVPAEHTSNNVLWLPKSSNLTVTYEKTRLRELAPISLQHDLTVNEKSYVYVMDDASDTILRQITFKPLAGRTSRYSEARDFAAAIDKATELVVAGQKVGDAVPKPTWSSYLNKIWGCASNVRAFHTLPSLGNWDQGSVIGDHDLVENEQVVMNVKGQKTGRILETLSFTPKANRLSLALWPKDFAEEINKTSTFIRAGRENTEKDLIEPFQEENKNLLWTPKGSMLEIEMQTFVPISKPQPGMSSETQQLFEQCMESRKHVTVDARTGIGVLRIPLAELFADDSLKNPLAISLSYEKSNGIHVQVGNFLNRVKLVSGNGGTAALITLRDGRVVSVSHGTIAMNGGDFTIRPFTEEIIDEFGAPQTIRAGYRVSYKDGSRDTFRFVIQTTNEYQVNWTQYMLPSGLCLDLEYNFFGLEQVSKGEQVLLKVDWHSFEELAQSGMWRLPKTIVIFPDSTTEKRTFTFVKASCNGQQTSLNGDGFATSGKINYLIKRDAAGNLTSFEAEHQHPFEKETDKAMHRETLEYDRDNRITRHTVAPGAGMDDLVHDYAYSGTTTTLVGYYKNATPRATLLRHHHFHNEQSCVERYGSDAVPLCKQRLHSLDTRNKWLVSQHRTWEGDVLVDQQTLALDGIGNPVRRNNNDEITQWTYYNNYQQFRITETETHVEDWSFFACLFKVIDYANPLGAIFAVGSYSGMTWGTRLDTTVEMLPAVNDYAKKAFDLPVDIVHCGSDRPFSGDVESELVSRKIGDQEVPQRLTFFGYGNFDGHIRAKQKLTILQPDCSLVDVTTEQLAVATKAAAPLVKSLKAQISAASAEEKSGYEEVLKDLNKSVEEQSKANSQGFRLNSKKSTGMTLETYDYHIDKTKPGYGMVACCKKSFVNDQGASDTPSTTISYAYSLDPSDSDKLVIETTVTDNEKVITSSQTRSRLTGRLLESTDSEGYKTVRSYDPLGNLLSETVSLDTVEVRKTTCTLTRNLVWQYDMKERRAITRHKHDAIGRRISQAAKQYGCTEFVETHRWDYDKLGRIASLVETDYNARNKKLTVRETQWSHDASGTITTTCLLKDSADKELNKVIRKRTPGARGECLSQGNFSIDRQFDAGKKLITEQYSLTGGEGCKIERSMSPEGLMTSVRYIRVESDNKETEQDTLDLTYDKYAQLTQAAPRIGAASSYTYDASGRLLTSTRDGVVLRNSYSQGNLSTAANSASVKSGSATKIKLGSQTVDFLGRVTEQCVGDNTVSFSYSGASTKGTRTTPGTAPTPLNGYVTDLYQIHLKETQNLYMQNASSTLEFSLGGRVIGFTDLTKAVTTYQYDFFDHLVGSESEHCVCNLTYADNGLLSSETVKAVKSDNLEMKVEYTYDGLGQEIKRTFTCTGVEISVERTLRGDGRLSRSVIKEKGTEKSADSYEYDDCLRLKKWVESPNRTDTYSYDLLGNTASHANSSSGNSDLFYHVDLKPGMVSKVFIQKTTNKDPDTATGTAKTYDAKGSLTIDGVRRLSYHDNGQVNTYSIDADKTKYTFSYDSEGRVRGGSNGTQTDYYHYRGDCVYALVQYDFAPGAAFTERSLVLRNESRACLLQDTRTDKKDSRSFELRDANGTVFASIDLATKAITYFRYEPYGKRHSGAKAENWLGFKGEPLNRVGLYHLGNGYRLYDPAWGRFLSRDSKSPFGVGGAAGYVFGNADPVNHADPSGREVVAQYSRWLGTGIIQSTAFRIVVGAVGVLLAPFTAGTSMLLAVATTVLAVLSFSFDVASIILSESDPELSRTLEGWGQAFGIASAAAGIGMGVNGLRSLPRNWFRVRGGPSIRFPVKWPKLPNELRIAQEARSRALIQLIQQADEAKAAGRFNAFKAASLNNDAAMTVGDVVRGTGSSSSFLQEAAGNGRSLFKGTIRQFDDSLFDLLGYTLDANSGPNVLIQKFMPATDSETERKSLVALPMPGRETLFP